jgi:nucleoside-diphosphate-sugar epimerase
MDVLVAGGHGQIARRLLRLLAKHGHTARGLIRNPDHVADLESDGAHPILCDLESDDVRPHLGGADAIVFAAGAGPGSGAERKQTLDLGGALKCIAAAQELGVERFLMVSSMGTRDIDPDSPMKPYLEAKRDADLALEDSGLRWTIVRPGRLTNTPGTGNVELAPRLGRYGEIPRDDVALVLYHCLFAGNTVHGSFELLSGSQPAEAAVLSFTSR